MQLFQGHNQPESKHPVLSSTKSWGFVFLLRFFFGVGAHVVVPRDYSWPSQCSGITHGGAQEVMNCAHAKHVIQG